MLDILNYSREAGGSLVAAKDRLEEGEKITLEKNTVICNKKMTVAFFAEDSVCVRAGHGCNEYSASYAEIDSEEIKVFFTGAETTAVLSRCHGLSIRGEVNLVISVGYGKADILLSAGGKSYEIKDVMWAGRNGNIFVQSVKGSPEKVAVRWYCGDYAKKIYAVGDSYFNPAAKERWTSYLLENGWCGQLLLGYPGMNSMTGLSEFKQAITVGKPDFAVWCLGMNDPDSESGINESYRKATDEFVIICREKGITPVLSTIPNVTSRTNVYKNRYVRSSKLRYIDFSRAVNPDLEAGEWYSGTLCPDGVHPSAPGAKALFIRAITDFPEFMNY